MGLTLTLSSEPLYLDDRADGIEGWTPEITPMNPTNAIVRIDCTFCFSFVYVYHSTTRRLFTSPLYAMISSWHSMPYFS